MIIMTSSEYLHFEINPVTISPSFQVLLALLGVGLFPPVLDSPWTLIPSS